MPSNHKGKGIKGGNYDEASGIGTSSAGRAGNLDERLSDDDAGNRQSADSGRQGGAQADSQQGATPPQRPHDAQDPGRPRDGQDQGVPRRRQR